jgi:type II secretory pathway pseudopilin PulG
MNATSHRARAFTMIEAVMALIVVSVLATASLAVVTQAARARELVQKQSTGMLLARTMLSEVASQSYADPEGGTNKGLDAGEDQMDRTTLDDIDDYEGYEQSCVTDRAGQDLGLTGWAWKVRIERVDAFDPSQIVVNDSGVKLITVTVFFKSVQVTEVSAIRSQTWDAMVDEGGV